MTVTIVDVSRARADLGKLLAAVAAGSLPEVIILRHGRPVARLVRLQRQPLRRRVGVAKGAFDVAPDPALDARVARSFQHR